MLFIDYSAAFDTTVPSKFITELGGGVLGLNPALCNWVLHSLLYSLFTRDCLAMHVSKSIIKFPDDTTA